MALMRLTADYGDCDSKGSSFSSEERGEMIFKRDLEYKGVLEERPLAVVKMINERVKGNNMSVKLALQRDIASKEVLEEIPLAVGKTTKKRVKGNIMSVELALQREFEYRKKIERLQQRPVYDCEEPPISVQEAPSNLELGKRNRRSSFDNVSCSQGRISDPMFFERELEHGRLQEEITIKEVTDKRVGTNTIPVEHAIQRELGYQRKMESVQHQPCTEFWEQPIPLQEYSPSNLGTVGIKRKAPSGDLACSFSEQVQVSYIQQSSGTHLVNLFCKECQVFCPSVDNLQQHYAGRKHKTRLEELKYEKNNGKKEVGLVWCNVCSIPCMNQLCYQQHLAGKKHAAAVQAINNVMTIGGKGVAEEVPMTNRKPNYNPSL